MEIWCFYLLQNFSFRFGLENSIFFFAKLKKFFFYLRFLEMWQHWNLISCCNNNKQQKSSIVVVVVAFFVIVLMYLCVFILYTYIVWINCLVIFIFAGIVPMYIFFLFRRFHLFFFYAEQKENGFFISLLLIYVRWNEIWQHCCRLVFLFFFVLIFDGSKGNWTRNERVWNIERICTQRWKGLNR